MTMSGRLEQAKRRLGNGGYPIAEERRLGNDSGFQLKLAAGPSVNVFDNGTIYVQGKKGDREAVEAALGDLLSKTGAAATKPIQRNVFVVYGHDTAARDQLEAMLHRWELNPLFLDQLPSEGQTVIEKLERYQGECSFAVVLVTPDDEGYNGDGEDEKAFRARQNVLLELGMMLSRLGRPRVAILIRDQEQMERPSDIQGLIYIPFSDRVSEASVQLAKEIEKQDLKVEVANL